MIQRYVDTGRGGCESSGDFPSPQSVVSLEGVMGGKGQRPSMRGWGCCTLSKDCAQNNAIVQ